MPGARPLADGEVPTTFSLGMGDARHAIAVLCVVALARTASGEAPGHRIDIAGVPAAGYTTDKGFGLGAAGALYVRSPGYLPYKYSLVLELFATTRGIQDHTLTFDAPRVFGSSWRPIVQIGYLRDKLRPFYGIGNSAPLALPGGQRKSRYFSYDLQSWYATLSLEDRLGGPWKLNLLYSFRSLSTRAHASTLLALEHPSGIGDGRSGRLDAEVIYDTRSEEASPVSGQYLALSLHGASPILGGTFTNGGLAGEAHEYFSPAHLGPHLVLAARILGDVTWGDVPVAMMPLFGGRTQVEGLGGSGSLRGLPRDRYLGAAKLVANFEVRSRAVRLTVFHRPLDLWGVAFFDAGRVWAHVAGDGPWWHFHYGRGLGVRVAYVEDFVVRLDYAFSEGNTAFYATLNQMF